MDNVRSLVDSFVSQLAAVVERQTLERARVSVANAFGRGGNGAKLALSGRPRRKLPRQLCPVPGCENTAAPIFGMVCAKHKDVPKVKIAKFREARRARKVKAA